jgi:hypothetical protein
MPELRDGDEKADDFEKMKPDQIFDCRFYRAAAAGRVWALPPTVKLPSTPLVSARVLAAAV